MHEQRFFFSIESVLFEFRGVMSNVVNHPHAKILCVSTEYLGKNFAYAVKNHLPICERHVQAAFHCSEIIAPFGRLKRRTRQLAVENFDAVFVLHHFQKNL